MKNVGAYEAKTHLSELLDAVQEGEDITITRYGQPVARLLPAGEEPENDVSESIRKLKEFRTGRKLGDADLSSMVDQGRA